VPTVVDKAFDFHTSYSLNLLELETILEQCQFVIAKTEDSDGELEDNKEVSCICGSIDLGKDPGSRLASADAAGSHPYARTSTLRGFKRRLLT